MPASFCSEFAFRRRVIALLPLSKRERIRLPRHHRMRPRTLYPIYFGTGPVCGAIQRHFLVTDRQGNLHSPVFECGRADNTRCLRMCCRILHSVVASRHLPVRQAQRNNVRQNRQGHRLREVRFLQHSRHFSMC